MDTQHKVAGYEEFKSKIVEIGKSAEIINIYFTGSIDEKTGKSWCPDCVVAKPFVENALKTIENDSVFLYVDVGNREFWKNMKNPFRTDKSTHLQVIPTLIRWKGPQRLEGDQCCKSELLDMFFNDDI